MAKIFKGYYIFIKVTFREIKMTIRQPRETCWSVEDNLGIIVTTSLNLHKCCKHIKTITRPNRPVPSEYRRLRAGLNCWCMTLAANLHLAQRLRMRNSLPAVSHVSSWCST
jgi:hypothetical protein